MDSKLFPASTDQGNTYEKESADSMVHEPNDETTPKSINESHITPQAIHPFIEVS